MKVLTAVSSILIIISQIHSVSAQSSAGYSISTFDQTKLTGLSLACENVYNGNISSCQMADFLPTIPCSSSCISGLNSIQTEAQAACSQAPVSAGSMLSLFVNGQGVQELCTTQKLASTTLKTSVISGTASATSLPTTSAATSLPTTSAATVHGGDAIGSSLSNGAVIAIVVSAIIASTILVFIGTALFRKHYTG